MKNAMLILCLMLASLQAQAKDLYGPYKADLVRVLDGDTVEVSVHVWPGLKQSIKLRIAGINTPEKRGRVSDCEKAAGKAATAFTENWLKDADTITVYDIHLGKWAGRVVGKLKKGGADLSQALINAGHAKPYDGGKREPWC